jgi:hypothetical protein
MSTQEKADLEKKNAKLDNWPNKMIHFHFSSKISSEDFYNQFTKMMPLITTFLQKSLELVVALKLNVNLKLSVAL